MAIELITYPAKEVTATNDAIMQELATGGGGIFSGCDITTSGNKLYISSCYGAIKGRMFSISPTEISVTLAQGDPLIGRLVAKLDLSNTEEPIALQVHTGSSLYTLVQQDDANYIAGVYEIGIARFKVTGTGITDITKEFYTLKSIVDTVYPVGAIYMSTVNTSPATLFGGRWEQISGRFLLAADSSHSAGTTGGAASHALSASEMPAHNHSLNNHTHTVPAHTHSATTSAAGDHTHNVSRLQRATPTTGATGYLAQGGADTTYPTSRDGSHKHNVVVSAKPAFNTTAAGGNTGNTGSGKAFSTMPPYLAVYVWKRTA